MMRSLLPALLFLLPGVLGAQAASYTFFGKGSSGSAPYLKVSGSPKLGTTFDVILAYGNPNNVCSHATSNWYAFMVTGVSNSRWGSVPLPLATSLGFTLLVSPDFITRSSVVSGTLCPPGYQTPSWTMPRKFQFSVPNQTILLGVKFYQQIILQRRDWGGAWLTSNGGHGVIGR